MIFVSSTVPLNKIHASKEEICKQGWFLFSAMIKKKILRRCLNILEKIVLGKILYVNLY